MKNKRIAAAFLGLLMAISVLCTACTGDPTPTTTLGTTTTQAPTTLQTPTTSQAPTTTTKLPEPTMGMRYTVTFVSAYSQVPAQAVEPGESAQQPVLEAVAGFSFAGWYESEDFSGPVFDFATPITESMTLYAKWEAVEDDRILYSYAGYECAAIEWEDENPAASRVGYCLTGVEGYRYVDAPLIRRIGENTARVDILGLKGGECYDFYIEHSDGTVLMLQNVAIAAYDRSGYAHFNYEEGVGAYNDDGSLKSGALVIYLTEENKNNIMDSAYVDGQKVDISEYMGSYTSIGQLLNNRGLPREDRYDKCITRLTQVYGAVTVRILGKVQAEQNADGTSTILGLTDYNSYGNGGSPGDNGRMARMVNAKNLTIEGVGEDACMDGWGIHFIADDESGKYPGAGESFEVRNIRFQNYPEDAVGMEGQQEDNYLKDPVERCWIHHNSFYPGYCEKPAESDKAEGDGSCDFKRGRYYTLSYNYFVDCHKTNLIGSGDSSLQYDITFHHNYWENCGSRIPLLRNANIHFYNNYIFADISQTHGSTGAKLGLSYVSSVRANSYMFSENNYYDGCKNVVQATSGGVVKAWGNTYYACFGDDHSVKVTGREEAVANNCKYAYEGIDYSSFDTDPALFYYDAENKRSDCYMTDAVTARLEVLQQAGTQKRAGTKVSTDMNVYTPDSALQMTGDRLEVTLNNIVSGTTVNGIYFAGKGGAAGLKGKGQVITFTLLSDTDIHVTVAAGGEANLGELVDSFGKVWAGKFTEFSGTLPAGTYFIASGSKDKEVTVTGLSFTRSATPEEMIAAVEAAIAAIPDSVSLECREVIRKAQAAFDSLPADLQARVANAQKLTEALDTLEALEEAAKPQRLKDLLAALPDSLGREDLPAFLEVQALYESLTDTQRDFTAQQQTKYDTACAQYEALKKANIVAIFTGMEPSLAANAGFTVSGNYKVGVTFEYEGTTYERPLKMESKTTVSFVTEEAVILKLKVDAAGVRIKIDGTNYTADAEGFVTVELKAGTHTITKGETCNLCYVILSPK